MNSFGLNFLLTSAFSLIVADQFAIHLIVSHTAVDPGWASTDLLSRFINTLYECNLCCRPPIRSQRLCCFHFTI